MPISFATNIREAQQRLSSYLITYGAALPAFTRGKVIEAQSAPSAVQRIVQSAEALYAAREGIGYDGRAMAAVLTQLATRHGWSKLDEDDRGGAMLGALLRENGEPPPAGMEWPDPADDPAPRRGFVEEASDAGDSE